MMAQATAMRRTMAARMLHVLLGWLMLLPGCELFQGPGIVPDPRPDVPSPPPPSDVLDGGVDDAATFLATYAPCLACLIRVIPADRPGFGVQSTLYFTYDRQDPFCLDRAQEWIDRVNTPIAFPPIESVRVGLGFGGNPTLSITAGPIEIDPDAAIDEGGPRWRLVLDAEELAAFEGDLDDLREVLLAGSCDAEANDCPDERPNEPISLPTLCGVGACAAIGELRCNGVATVSDCTPGLPGFERCDGIDNDCDGRVDLGRCYDGSVATEGVGLCNAGTLSCDPLTGDADCAGQVTPAVERLGSGPSQEDEDCDNQIDEISFGCADCDGPSISVPVSTLPPGQRHRVIVALRPLAEVSPDPVTRSADVAALQARIIDELRGLAIGEGMYFEVLRRYRLVYGFVAEADTAVVTLLARHPDVKSVTRDLGLAPALTEAEARIGAERARREGGANGSGVTVAVIDTGVDYTQAVFGRCGAPGDALCTIVGGHDFVDDDDDPFDPRDHGTDMAQIIAGRGGDGTHTGIAPGSELVALRVVDETGNAWLSDVIAAYDWLLDHPEHGVRVVNLSLTSERVFGRADCAAYGAVLDDVVTELAGAGVLTVAAAGNTGQLEGIGLGACVESILALGATYDAPVPGVVEHEAAGCTDGADTPIVADTVVCLSAGRQASPPSLDLFAPGAGISVTRGGASHRVPAGTSVSSAVASGAAAVLFSARPGSTPAEVVRQLKTTAVPVATPQIPARRLDLDAALARLCLDADGDGFGGGGADCDAPLDCADDDPERFPGRVERQNGVDDDCDGATDEGGGCELVVVREASPAAGCNALSGRADDFDACIATPGVCRDQPDRLMGWCSRQIAGSESLWYEAQLPLMEALHPGICRAWGRVVQLDGEVWFHCTTFEAGYCPESVLAFE